MQHHTGLQTIKTHETRERHTNNVSTKPPFQTERGKRGRQHTTRYSCRTSAFRLRMRGFLTSAPITPEPATPIPPPPSSPSSPAPPPASASTAAAATPIPGGSIASPSPCVASFTPPAAASDGARGTGMPFGKVRRLLLTPPPPFGRSERVSELGPRWALGPIVADWTIPLPPLTPLAPTPTPAPLLALEAPPTSAGSTMAPTTAPFGVTIEAVSASPGGRSCCCCCCLCRWAGPPPAFCPPLPPGSFTTYGLRSRPFTGNCVMPASKTIPDDFATDMEPEGVKEGRIKGESGGSHESRRAHSSLSLSISPASLPPPTCFALLRNHQPYRLTSTILVFSTTASLS